MAKVEQIAQFLYSDAELAKFSGNAKDGKEEFLSHLCQDKAGLSASAWKDGSTELYTFEAQVFSE